jgi:predicted HTH domain antitoxin
MSDRITIVISPELNQEIEDLRKVLKMDKSTFLRQLISKSLQDFRLQIALEQYTQEKVSLGRAAKIANMNLWEFLGHCRQHHVEMPFSEIDAEMGIQQVESFDIRKYKDKITKNRKLKEKLDGG